MAPCATRACLQANLTALRGEMYTADGTKVVGRTVAPDGTVGRTYLDPNMRLPRRLS